MTQEDKKLLLKDLCARLPYGVMVQCITESARMANASPLTETLNTVLYRYVEEDNIELKPYLRPMSSMTDEEKQVLELCNAFVEPRSIELKVDFYNQCHLDYRGLIEKSLAIEVTKDNNPYKD